MVIKTYLEEKGIFLPSYEKNSDVDSEIIVKGNINDASKVSRYVYNKLREKRDKVYKILSDYVKMFKFTLINNRIYKVKLVKECGFFSNDGERLFYDKNEPHFIKVQHNFLNFDSKKNFYLVRCKLIFRLKDFITGDIFYGYSEAIDISVSW